MNRMKRKSLLCLALAVLAVLTACGTTNNEQQNGGNDSIVVRATADPNTFDPIMTNDVATQKMLYQIYDTLIWDEQDGTLVPGLAESWEYSDDNTVITFNLRQDVKFHNGDTMTADDVEFSLNRAIASSYTSKFTSAMDRAEKTGDYQVALYLKYPYSAIEQCLTCNSTAIVCKAAVEADPDGFASNPVGTGPYQLVEMKSGDQIIMKAFDDYYRGKAAIENLTFKIIGDSSAALIALETGAVDMIEPSHSYTDRQALIENEDVGYYEEEQACYFLVAFNNSDGRFTDSRLRQAVRYALNKEDMIEGAINGIGSRVDAAMVPICADYLDDFPQSEYNLDKAKALMEEAGYGDGMTVKLKVISAEGYTKPAEIIQEQLRAINIEVEVEPMERAAWFDDVFNGENYEMTFYAIAVAAADPDFAIYSWFNSQYAHGSGNFINYENAELDELMTKARQSSDGQERAGLYTEICEIIDRDCALIPMYVGMRTVAADVKLQGVKADPYLKYYVYNYSWAE